MDERTDVAELFRSRWDEFTRTDRKVARVILANYPAAGLETLARLSERANVSAPSILRCIKKLGFDGYPEFQQALHAELHEKIRNATDRSPIEVEGSASHLPEQVRERSHGYYFNIGETFDLLQAAELDEAVSLIADDTRALTMIGGQVAGALARLMYHRMVMIRPNCSLLGRDPLERSERLIDISKRDVLLIFDHPPYDSGTASFASLARERHARIVLFTDTSMSPISEFADSVLCAAGGLPEDFSIVSTACLAEVVIAEVRRKVGEGAADRRRQLKEINR